MSELKVDEREVIEFINAVLRIIESHKDETTETKKQQIRKEVERRIKYVTPENNI